MMYIRLYTFSVSFCFSAPPKFMIYLKTLDKQLPPLLCNMHGGDIFPCVGKVVGLFMGWVLKGSRQKLVVCRYEEEPARGVSLVVK